MPEKRSYSSALREEQTALTRRRILAAAVELFTTNGYLGTTLAAVAAAAGVSVQTVYNVVGGKPAVLKAAYDVTLAGDDEPIPILERPLIRNMLVAPDARSCLALYAELARGIAERTLPLAGVVLAQAATGDRDLQAFAETTESERAVGSSGTARLVSERFGLRPGLTVEAAADILWVLTSWDVADRLANRRGWGWDRYQSWLATTMADALVGLVSGSDLGRRRPERRSALRSGATPMWLSPGLPWQSCRRKCPHSAGNSGDRLRTSPT